MVCNHPTGIADGFAVYDALQGRAARPVFYANADAQRVAPRLGEALIPVEWVEAKRTREKTRDTLAATREALEAERCLVIFPAGRLARRAAGRRADRSAWCRARLAGPQVRGAGRADAHGRARSTLFHLFDRVSPELRDITLFHEMLNKRGRPLQPDGRPADPAGALTSTRRRRRALKAFVERVLPSRSRRGLRMSRRMIAGRRGRHRRAGRGDRAARCGPATPSACPARWAPASRPWPAP